MDVGTRAFPPLYVSFPLMCAPASCVSRGSFVAFHSAVDEADDGEVDESGVEESDVKLVMDQAQVCS